MIELFLSVVFLSVYILQNILMSNISWVFNCCNQSYVSCYNNPLHDLKKHEQYLEDQLMWII